MKKTITALLCAMLLLTLCAPAITDEESIDLAAINSAVITLNQTSITAKGFGVTVSGTKAVINMPGVYTLSGTLENGQIVVDCAMDEKVELVLSGVNIHCEQSAPILILKSEKRTTIRLDEGTENTLSCGDSLTGDVDGAIYSKGDLTITGEGSLTVRAQNVDAIVSKDDLRIKGGDITVITDEDGIRGKDSVEIYDGRITITAGGDGIKSTNTENASRGFIQISGGEIFITYGDELLQAASKVSLTGGVLYATYLPED